jgi:hypothetical protein
LEVRPRPLDPRPGKLLRRLEGRTSGSLPNSIAQIPRSVEAATTQPR